MRSVSGIALSVFLLITSNAMGQVRFGIKAGPNRTAFSQNYGGDEQFSFNLSQVEGNMDVHEGDLLPGVGISRVLDPYAGWGYGVGGYMDAPVIGVFEVRLELMYSLRSVEGDFRSHTNVQLPDADAVYTTYQATEELGTYSQDLGYLEIPLLAGFRIPEARFHLGFGGAFLLGGRSNYRGETGSITWRERNTTDGYQLAEQLALTHNTLDVSYAGKEATSGLNSVQWAAIAGVEFPLGETFSLGLRYWQGLNSVQVNTPYPDGSKFTSLHQVFQFTVGIGLCHSVEQAPVATAP